MPTVRQRKVDACEGARRGVHEKLHEPEKVHAAHGQPHNRFYLVSWKGHDADGNPHDDVTWEPAHHIDEEHQKLIDNFWTDNPSLDRQERIMPSECTEQPGYAEESRWMGLCEWSGASFAGSAKRKQTARLTS